MIRETKKNEIVNSLMGNSSSNNETITVVPGRIAVIRFPLRNDTQRMEVFTFKFIDPDEQLLLSKNKDGKVTADRSELRVPNTREELIYLVKNGKIERPP